MNEEEKKCINRFLDFVSCRVVQLSEDEISSKGAVVRDADENYRLSSDGGVFVIEGNETKTAYGSILDVIRDGWRAV